MMPISRQDCVELGRSIQSLLKQYDPDALSLVLHAIKPDDDPRRYLVQLLGTTIRVYSERSGGMYGPILDRINRFVRLEDGSPVQGLSVELSPAERELYNTEQVNLAQLADRSEFLKDLGGILAEIIRETESPERQQ